METELDLAAGQKQRKNGVSSKVELENQGGATDDFFEKKITAILTSDHSCAPAGSHAESPPFLL